MKANISPIFRTFWSKSGLAADRPAATGLRDGSLWNSTDTNDIDQVQGGAWATILDYSVVTASVLTTRGDLLVRGASDDERLPLGSIGQILMAFGNDPVWYDAPTGPPKEIFFNSSDVPYNNRTVVDGYSVSAIDTGDRLAHMNGKIPHDFTSIDKAVIVIIGGSSPLTPSEASKAYTKYGAIGEAAAAHAQQNNALTPVSTISGGVLGELIIDDLFTDLVADDYFSVTLEWAQEEFYVVGFLLKYS